MTCVKTMLPVPVDSLMMTMLTTTVTMQRRDIEAVYLVDFETQDSIIDDFFHSRLTIYQTDHFHQVIGRFKELTHLDLNFNCMLEELVCNLAAMCSGKPISF